MKERDCEKGCYFFHALKIHDKQLNRLARGMALKGEESSLTLSTMCGGCRAIERNEEDLRK